MRFVLISLLGVLLTGCATPVRIDWAGTAQGVMQGVCRQSSRCDVPACDRDSRESGPCDNPYRRGGVGTPVPQPRPINS